MHFRQNGNKPGSTGLFSSGNKAAGTRLKFQDLFWDNAPHIAQ